MSEQLSPFSGIVSKAPLLVAPCFAQDKELLHYLKYKLFDNGFIVIREEYRLINPELAEKLCVSVDHIHPCLQEATKLSPESSPEPDSNVSSVPRMPPADMLGTAYIYILACSSCHAKLTEFVSNLMTDDTVFRSMVETQRNTLTAEGAHVALTPLMCNATANGAKQAVSVLFPQMLAADIPTAVVAREYVQANLKTVLLSALTEVAKAKPSNPIEWLAHRLLETNIQAPPMERM